MRKSMIRSGLAAVAVTAAAALAAPSAASADPALPIPAQPQIDQKVLAAFGNFVPAIIGSVATPDATGKVNADLLAQARTLAADPTTPPDLAKVWQQLLDFLSNKDRGKGGPKIPTGNGAPVIQQFLYPTVGNGCIAGGSSVGFALTTAGPQQAPAPGPKAGEAGFVYTSLGTGPALKNNGAPLTVAWINIENGRTGQQTLAPNPKINATQGPGTFTAIAKTGKGRVISAVYGNVTTKQKNNKPISCTIVPTVGLSYI